MTTVQQTGSIDLAAQNGAAKTATNYMYFDSTNGLKIASSSPSSATRRVQIKPNGIGIYNDNRNYSYIDSNGMNIYKGGNSVAAFGDTARIGEQESLHMTLLNGGIRIYEKEETPFADSSTAKFTGTESVIGEVKDIHTQISSDGFGILNGETKLFSIDTEQKMTTHSQDSSWEVKQLVFDEVIGEGTITDSSGYLRGNGNVHTSADDPEWCWISSSKLRAKPQIFLDMAGYSNDTQREWVPIEELEEYVYYDYTEPEIYDSDNYRFYFSVQIYDTSLLPIRWKIGIAHYERNLTVQIGKNNESHVEIDYHSLKLIDKNGNAYFHISDLRDTNGYVTDIFEGNGSTQYFYLSAPPTSSSQVIVTVNDSVIANGTTGLTITTEYVFFGANILPTSGSIIKIKYKPATVYEEISKAYSLGTRKINKPIGFYSLAEGYNITASGLYSYAEGYNTEASGNYSHAEGSTVYAQGNYSHAEGNTTRAQGSCSHAEGYNLFAKGSYSHAEGIGTLANGTASHAEGQDTKAYGNYSHSQNYNTIAQRKSQTVLGEYNIADTSGSSASSRGEYAFIIGNGTSSSARSNAATIAWNGNYMAQAMAGIIQMFAGPSTNIPTGWLLCDGSYVSKTTYPTLYDAIGYTWGAESSVPTGYFALPDFRGRGPKGPVTGNDVTQSSKNLAISGYHIGYTPDLYCAYWYTLYENLTVSTQYTIQLWDVDVLQSGKDASTIGVAIYWGGGSVNLVNFIGSSYFTVREDHIHSNTIMYHADYLEAVITTPSTAGAVANRLDIYNSTPDISGTAKWMHIGKLQIKKGSHSKDPYEPYPQYRNYGLGGYGGNDFYCLNTSQLPSHTHTLSSHTHTLSSHTHGFGGQVWAAKSGTGATEPGGGISGSGKYYPAANATGYAWKTSSEGPSNNTSGTPSNNTSGPTGNGNAPDNNAPYATVNFIICTGKTS